MLQGARAARRGGCVPVLLVLAVVWGATFALSRAHMALQAYTDLQEVRENESWLLQQCGASEFYSRMKAHSALCDDVAHKARDVLAFKAIQHVIDHSYLCGYTPCSELLDGLALWAVGRGLVFSLAALALLVLGPVFLVPMYRRQLNSLADARMQHLYRAGCHDAPGGRWIAVGADFDGGAAAGGGRHYAALT